MSENNMTTEVKLCTTAEAVKLFRRAPTGVAFCLGIRLDAPVVNDPEHVFPDACSTYLNLGRKDAVRIVGELLSSTLEERGGRIRVRIVTSQYATKSQVTYWI